MTSPRVTTTCGHGLTVSAICPPGIPMGHFARNLAMACPRCEYENRGFVPQAVLSDPEGES